MAKEQIFVGRTAELERFTEVLAELRGQAVLVVGQEGMGKTMLVNRMAGLAEGHPELECGWVRYEVTKTDSVDSTLELMIDHAFRAAQVQEGSFDGTPRGLEQWRSLLNVLKIGDLAMSLRRDPKQHTRDQFRSKMELISERMKANQRAILIVDPEKYMQVGSDEAWAIVTKQLPEKIKLVFAQRTEDVLVNSRTFGVLDNVVRIPAERLDVLDEKEVDELLDIRCGGLSYSVTEVRKGLSRYKGHPYSVQGALDLLDDGTELEALPADPKGIAGAQWERVCQEGDGAIELFEAYALLDVPVPDDVVEPVSGIVPSTRKSLFSNNYLRGLLREEGEGRRIYHAILADYITEQIDNKQGKEYHARAVTVYRERLKADIKPDELAARRLAEHVLAAEGEEAFVDVLLNESFPVLYTLGLLDAALSLSEQALVLVEKKSAEEAMLFGNLGVVYRRQGNLNKAEEMYLKSLRISEELGNLELTTNQYGNIAVLYYTRGDLDKAEKMLLKSLEIAKELGLLEFVATCYGNLGTVYMERGNLDKAEEMYLKALATNEELGRLEGIANNYGNLGLLYTDQEDLDKAEEMYLKSLKISEECGLLELTANQYTNLGTLYGKRGEVGKAREYWEKARDLFVKIGMPHMAKKVQGWLDRLEE